MLSGVGLGLRWEFIHDLVNDLPPLPFLEVSPENYIERGGYYAWALDRAAEHYPLISHGLSLSLAGSDPFDRDYLGALKTFLRERRAPYHSDHLSFGTVNGVALHDLLPPIFTLREAKRIATRVREVQDAVNVPMAIENISYYLPSKPSESDGDEMSEGEFVAEVLREADCGLLLDINNAFVNATNFSTSVDAFFDALPLDRVVQVHLAGHEWIENEVGEATERLIVDTHGSDVVPDVREIFRRLAPRLPKVPIVLERDENVPALPDLLNEVRELQMIYDEARR